MSEPFVVHLPRLRTGVVVVNVALTIWGVYLVGGRGGEGGGGGGRGGSGGSWLSGQWKSRES